MESELISFSCYSFFNWAGYREFLMECPVYLLFNEESYLDAIFDPLFFFLFFFFRSKKNFSLRDFRKVRRLRFILFIGGEFEIVVKEKKGKSWKNLMKSRNVHRNFLFLESNAFVTLDITS